MTTPESLGPDRVRNDIEGAMEAVAAHEGEAPGLRQRLFRIVAGLDHDRAIFHLVHDIARWLAKQPVLPPATGWLLTATLPTASSPMSPFHRALLNFLLSMDDFSHCQAVQHAFDDLAAAVARGADMRAAVRTCSNALARLLHAYRTRHFLRRRQEYRDLVAWLHEQGRPDFIDGDALRFWFQHASRTRWTLYATVLAHMKHYSRAARMERALPQQLSTLAPETDEQDVLDRHARAPSEVFNGTLSERLEMALAHLEQSNIKLLLKKTEWSQLSEIAEDGEFALLWPRSMAVRDAFMPCQLRIVQHLRRQAHGRPDVEKMHCRDMATYADLVKAVAELRALLHDMILLRHRLDPSSEPHEMPSELSNAIDRMTERNTPLLRRKACREADPQKLAASLKEAEGALHDLVQHLERMEKLWRQALRVEENGTWEEDCETFSAVLRRLYGDEA